MALSALSSGRWPCDGATLTDPLVFLAKTEQMVAGPEGCYWHTSASQWRGTNDGFPPTSPFPDRAVKVSLGAGEPFRMRS
jgi:hypothetical protein